MREFDLLGGVRGLDGGGGCSRDGRRRRGGRSRERAERGDSPRPRPGCSRPRPGYLRPHPRSGYPRPRPRPGCPRPAFRGEHGGEFPRAVRSRIRGRRGVHLDAKLRRERDATRARRAARVRARGVRTGFEPSTFGSPPSASNRAPGGFFARGGAAFAAWCRKNCASFAAALPNESNDCTAGRSHTLSCPRTLPYPNRSSAKITAPKSFL